MQYPMPFEDQQSKHRCRLCFSWCICLIHQAQRLGAEDVAHVQLS